MPIHVPAAIHPRTRRSFLVTTGTMGVWAYAPSRRGIGADDSGVDPNLFALLSDTHVASPRDTIARETNMFENLRKVLDEVRGMERRPSHLMINGDCAYLKGVKEDYTVLAELLEPVRALGLPLHLMMGNHDHREHLFGALADQQPQAPPVSSKHVSVIESEHVNWFLLDSLKEVNVVTGELGEAQRNWLAEALDARPSKPAVVMVHHNPQETPPEDGKAWSGIRDTAEFYSVLESRKQVKALIFGHTHNWNVSKRGNLHLVNLPPVAYVFSAGKPNGWVAAQAHPDALLLTLRTLDPLHPQSNQVVELAWA